jgi:type II secretory pathway component PulJ
MRTGLCNRIFRRRYSWQFFNKASQINREQKAREERLYSLEEVIATLESDGLEVTEREAGAQSSFGDGTVTRITLRKKPLQ